MENTEKYLLLTFNSVNHTMQVESVLKEMGKKIKTIPTPREVSRSCGLAILLDINELQTIIDLKNEGKSIDYIWQFEKTIDRGNIVTAVEVG